MNSTEFNTHFKRKYPCFLLHEAAWAKQELSSMNPTISILSEIPEDLHESLSNYLETHPDWNCDRVFSAALSLFLLQNGTSTNLEANRNYRRTTRVYLDALFEHHVN